MLETFRGVDNHETEECRCEVSSHESHVSGTETPTSRWDLTCRVGFPFSRTIVEDSFDTSSSEDWRLRYFFLVPALKSIIWVVWGWEPPHCCCLAEINRQRPVLPNVMIDEIKEHILIRIPFHSSFKVRYVRLDMSVLNWWKVILSCTIKEFFESPETYKGLTVGNETRKPECPPDFCLEQFSNFEGRYTWAASACTYVTFGNKVGKIPHICISWNACQGVFLTFQVFCLC